MRVNRRKFGILAGAVFVTTASMRQRPAQAQSADARAVATAVDALNKAMIEVDRTRLEALTADGLSYGHSAGRIETKQQFVEYLVSRASAFRSINLSDQTISIVASDAIVRHILTGETVNPAGQVTPVRIGVLQVWQKQASDWRLLARQAYRL
jgi:hypothetical protein